ncbi:MAG: OBAP family protein [Methylococcaceae bacterium]|nr:OBAP family protein [Methylococcaceae bacterium]
MKLKILIASIALPLMFGSANAEAEKKTASVNAPRQYNKVFNPRQKEYPNHLGFNDLHIQAIRHLVPDSKDVNDPKLQTIVHHHCKAYADSTFLCLMFHSGMKDQDKPIGFEYIITTAQFNKLPKEEKKYWHYHKEEVPRAHATFPDLNADEAAEILPAINETYGKVVYFQQPQHEFSLGEPYVVIVQDMPEQD